MSMICPDCKMHLDQFCSVVDSTGYARCLDKYLRTENKIIISMSEYNGLISKLKSNHLEMSEMNKHHYSVDALIERIEELKKDNEFVLSVARKYKDKMVDKMVEWYPAIKIMFLNSCSECYQDNCKGCNLRLVFDEIKKEAGESNE